MRREPTVAERGAVAVLAPAPLLTVTVEPSSAGDEVHFHPGGQGAWIARLVAQLEVDVVLCSSFGGESGMMIEGLLSKLWDMNVRAVPAEGWNAVYVHDRRSGARQPIADTPTPRRSRHEVDELYGAILVAGVGSNVVVLGGPESPGGRRCEIPDVIPLDVYRRLPQDLHENGTLVIADASGAVLDAVVDGGVDLLKVSDEELELCGLIPDRTTTSIAGAIEDLVGRGVRWVVVTCGDGPTLAHLDGRLVRVAGPHVTPIDDSGAGDSVTAGLAAALAGGASAADAMRLGAAAGALNVTRRGRGSGNRQEIELLARHVTIEEVI